MAWKFAFGNQPRFNGRENTSSGKVQQPMKLENGAKDVGRVLGAGEPGKATGFRPGGANGYNVVGGVSGMQVKIPSIRDQSNVHQGKGVNPENILTGGAVEPTKNNA